MDAQQLLILKPEDVADAVGLFVFAVALAAFGGMFAFHLLRDIGAAIGSIVRSTIWFNRRQADMYFRLAEREGQLTRMEPRQREAFITKCMERSAKHFNRAAQLQRQREFRHMRTQLRKSGS